MKKNQSKQKFTQKIKDKFITTILMTYAIITIIALVFFSPLILTLLGILCIGLFCYTYKKPVESEEDKEEVKEYDEKKDIQE